MSLYTKYTQEEINFLVFLRKNKKKEVKDLTKIPLFKNVDKREFQYIYIRMFDAKEVLSDFDQGLIIKGSVAIIEGKRIIKRLGINEVIGLRNLISNRQSYHILMLQETEIMLFKLKSNSSNFFYNLLTQNIIENCKEIL